MIYYIKTFYYTARIGYSAAGEGGNRRAESVCGSTRGTFTSKKT
jgi:hypothetical protein